MTLKAVQCCVCCPRALETSVTDLAVRQIGWDDRLVSSCVQGWSVCHDFLKLSTIDAFAGLVYYLYLFGLFLSYHLRGRQVILLLSLCNHQCCLLGKFPSSCCFSFHNIILTHSLLAQFTRRHGLVCHSRCLRVSLLTCFVDSIQQVIHPILACRVILDLRSYMSTQHIVMYQPAAVVLFPLPCESTHRNNAVSPVGESASTLDIRSSLPRDADKT